MKELTMCKSSNSQGVILNVCPSDLPYYNNLVGRDGYTF
jgi:hypothetical protein